DAAGTSVEKKTVKCDADPFQQKVKFQYRPAEPGFQIVSVRAMLVDEDREPLETKSDREVTSENNTRVIAVDRGGGPYRILYVSGRPNWEFKFLRRALEEDVEIDLDGLVRIAKEEPKFSFRDRGVETSNPLLAGFSEDDSAEQYDEPVLLRLGVDEGELKSGFPSVEEDLFAYHAIILDDVEASFFTQQQMLLMREFVSARGGGFMMLGGQESFVGGGYRDTPLGDVLPIYLRGTERKSAMEVPMRYQLSREGSLEPWLRLRDNRSDEQKRVRQMPDFATWNAATEVKPGASILATLESPDRQQPGLVAHRFGRGRAMALMLGDFWRWSMRRATMETDDLAQSWRQMTRWLTSDVPRRLEVEVRSSASLSQPTQVRIILRDEAFKPLDNAEVRIEVKEPDGVTVTATATPHPTDRGVYVADYWALKDGGYACTVLAKGPSGEELEPRDTGWTAQPSAVEFSQVQYNRKLVDELAAKSGGEVIELDALDQFVESLPSKKVPITESRVEPIWHRPWLILLAILCLCGEWGIRRWKGLP
ncbi:MAG: glutamine amidotransferase, partial [Planctomycetota bacterium]